MLDRGRFSRRQLLRAGGSGAFLAFAGCSTEIGSSTDRPVPDSGDGEFPQIQSYDATPKEDGTVLAVEMSGVSNREISYASIRYGARKLEAHPGKKEISISGRLDEIHDAVSGGVGRTVYLLRDEAGNETRAETFPDKSAPQLSITGQPQSSSGGLNLRIEGHDQTGLHHLRIRAGNSTVFERDITGKPSFTIKETISAHDYADIQAGEWNTLQAILEDAFGNRTRKQISAYVREYDRVDDRGLNISARYIPYAGDGLGRCLTNIDIEPAVGRYETPADEPIPASVTTKHIDQMTGHGIARTTLVFNGKERSFKYVREFLKSELIDDIEVEPSYGMRALTDNMDKSWKNEVLPEDLQFLRDTIMRRDNAATFRDRPLFHIWNAVQFAGGETLRQKVIEDFGDFESFVDNIREHLRIGQTEPYLVAGTGTAGPSLSTSDEAKSLISEFDAATTWVPGNVDPGSTVRWDNTVDGVIEDFETTREFTETHDMEFIPTVFPGFNDQGNTCYGGGRHLPRDPKKFRRLLEMADNYRSTNLINIATWNDWVEGTQIEPGAYRGTQYGNTYLDLINKF
jgi:hypothetical protein